MKKFLIITTIASLLSSYAYAGSHDSIQKQVLSKASQSGQGVILAVTERGQVAEDTAWLLAHQLERDKSYTPLFVAFNEKERKSTLKDLHLEKSSLPALIFFDKNGHEVNRVIGALPVKHNKIQSASIEPFTFLD
ncbi:MAG: hypothetical protein ACOYMJ_04820 [Candidatus Methylopumilus universalis]